MAHGRGAAVRPGVTQCQSHYRKWNGSANNGLSFVRRGVKSEIRSSSLAAPAIQTGRQAGVEQHSGQPGLSGATGDAPIGAAQTSRRCFATRLGCHREAGKQSGPGRCVDRDSSGSARGRGKKKTALRPQCEENHKEPSQSKSIRSSRWPMIGIVDQTVVFQLELVTRRWTQALGTNSLLRSVM